MRLAQLLLGIVVTIGCLRAQDWVFVRDDYSEAIQPKTDTITATLRTSRVKTKGTFLTNVNDVGIVLEASVIGSAKDQSGNRTPQQASFPLGYKAPNPDKTKAIANLPFDSLLIPNLTLQDKTAEYDSLTLNVSLVKVNEASIWGKITSKLIGLAASANIPASPYSIAAKYVIDFANASISDALTNLGKDVKVSLGQKVINLRVNPPARTGSYLLIDTAPDSMAGPGTVDPNNLAGRCFYLKEAGGTTTITVGQAVPNASDTDGDGCSKKTYTALQNPYVRILLQKRVSVSGPAVMSVAERQRTLKQCALAGLTEEKCIAAKPI